MSIDESEFREFMTTIQSLDESSLGNVLYSFPNPISKEKLTCRFFLIECTKDEIREEDFIQFIINRIIVYALQRKEYNQEGLTVEESASRMRDIVKKAKSKFVRQPTTGEVGELILFLILESQGILQLLNKMNLKSSGQMHYHGLDAIHIQIDDGIILHYGQSKMHSNFSDGVNDAVKDIEQFDRDREEFEINLVSSYIDRSRYDKYADELVEFLSPYSLKRNMSKTNAVFIGYNSVLMSTQKPESEPSLCDYLQNKHQKKHDNLFDTVNRSIKNNLSSDNRPTTFYILPFRNVGKFRTKFLEELDK